MPASCKITYFANAGFALEFRNKCIYVDALINYRVLGFSSLSPAQIDTIVSSDQAPPDYLIFTHSHPDHYSKKLTARALEQWPNTILISPQEDFAGQVLVTGDRWEYHCDELTFTFFKLPHEKNRYPMVPHYGITISDGSASILITGDSEIACPELDQALEGKRPDLVFLNFPWLNFTRGRDFIQSHYSDIPVVILHLPFPEDDVNDFRSAAALGLKRLGSPSNILLMEAFQQEINISFN